MKKIVIKHIQKELQEVLSVSDEVYSKIIEQNDTDSLKELLHSLESFKGVSVHYIHVYEYTGEEINKTPKEKKKKESLIDKTIDIEDNSGCIMGFFKLIFWLFKGLFRLIGGIVKIFD